MKNIKKIVKRSGTSFFWGMRILPLAKRNAIYTIYAFFRHIDDIVDGETKVQEKMDLIKAWRQELNNIYDKKVPTTEIGRRIYKNCMRFHLPKSEFVKMLDCISMDLPNPLQAPSLKQFDEYCRGVAGVPGSMALRIFGCDDEALIEKLASSLGKALQITNILRDVKEDALSGRIYIPAEILNEAGITSRKAEMVLVDKNLAIAREKLSQIAENEYRKAFALLPDLAKNVARPVKIIANIYKYYFDIMKNRGWEVISPKPIISKPTKFCIIVKSIFGK